MAKLRSIIETTTAPAPVKPKPSAPPQPKPKPDFKPWNPPKPKEEPSPKAKILYNIMEAYDDEVNPSTRKFWGDIRTSNHIFSKHPIMAMYGEESVKKAFQDNIDRLSKAFPEYSNLPPQQRLQSIYQEVMDIFMNAMQIESRYKRQLEQIAKEVVSEVYGIPEEMMIAQLGMSGSDQFKQQDEDQFEQDEEPESDISPDTPDLTDQINKRITLNALTQGAAVHNMMTIYKLASQKLNNLNPKFVQLYDKLSPGMLSSYWLMDFLAMAATLGQHVAGSTKVQYSDDSNEPKIVAQAMCFPILIQELVKGAMEILSHHGLSNLDQASTKKVLQTADTLTDEPWLIQVGPHLWRSFLKIVPKGSDLATVVAKLATQDPKFIHDLLSQSLEELHLDRDPAKQRQALQEIITDIEDYIGDDIGDDVEDWT